MHRLWAALASAGILAGMAGPASAATYLVNVDMTISGAGGSGTFAPITLNTGDTLTLTGSFLTPLYLADTPSLVFIGLNYFQNAVSDGGFTHLRYSYFGNLNGFTPQPPVSAGGRVLHPGTYTGLDPVGVTVDTQPPGAGGSYVLSRYSFFATTVPEPAAWGLFMMGLGLTGALLRRQRATGRLAGA